jgi:hypothetical protein
MSERSPKSSSKRRSERRSERSPREVPPGSKDKPIQTNNPEEGELASFQKKGYRTAQERAEHESALYHERGLNTNWKKMELRLQPGEYSSAKGELTSYETDSKIKADAETARKIKAEAETTLLQQNKELQEKYNKVMERNIYYDGRIDKHDEEDNKLRTLIAELRAHIAQHCPKKTFKTIRKIKTLGGQKQKNKSKKPKSNKTKKRKYKRSKHRHTKKPN